MRQQMFAEPKINAFNRYLNFSYAKIKYTLSQFGLKVEAFFTMYKILVVDDDVDLLDMLKLFLEKQNFMVYAISKWENILPAINAFDPTLILLDISLSGADGRVICKQLKTNKETENIPILLFSANYQVKHTIREFLADDFIEKPFDLADFTSRINLILSKYKPH